MRHNSPNSKLVFEIDADTDLIASGLLDSFSLVDSIAYIENESGCQVDFTDTPSEVQS